MKYVIRNCNVLYFNPDKTAICNDLYLECPCYCKDRTDCVLKRIVDLCKQQQQEFDTKVQNGNYPDKYKFFKSGRADAGKEILAKFDIREIE